jgi:uncharacterized membrane protein YidH (DUF202 family)
MAVGQNDKSIIFAVTGIFILLIGVILLYYGLINYRNEDKRRNSIIWIILASVGLLISIILIIVGIYFKYRGNNKRQITQPSINSQF